MEYDFEIMRQLMGEFIPHMAATGLELLSMDDDGAVGKIPYRDEFVGIPTSAWCMAAW